MQGNGKRQRVRESRAGAEAEAGSKVRVIPRARVQDPDQGHKEGQGKKSRFRSRK